MKSSFTLFRNLYAHHDDRSPGLNGGFPGTELELDMASNVIYDWGFRAVRTSRQTRVNLVNNHFIAGSSTTELNFAVHELEPGGQFYHQGNLWDVQPKDGQMNGIPLTDAEFDPTITLTGAAFAFSEVTTPVPVEDAFETIVAGAGSSLARDAVDQRIIHQLTSQSGRLIDSQDDVGGFPALHSAAPPADVDRDGMADSYELANGLDPTDPSDRNSDPNKDGYTALEEYLNSITAQSSSAACDFNGDSNCDSTDLYFMYSENHYNLVVGEPETDPKYDLVDDDVINNLDLSEWLSLAATENGYASPYLRGDTDGLGGYGGRRIDISDYNTVASNYNPTFSTLSWGQGNFDGDGDVDLADLNALASNFGPSGYVASIQSIPEPSPLMLTILGLLTVAPAFRVR